MRIALSSAWVPCKKSLRIFIATACIFSMWLVFVHCTQVAWGPASKVIMEFEENTIQTNCLCLLQNLLAWAMMSRGCHRREKKLPEGAGWETTD